MSVSSASLHDTARRTETLSTPQRDAEDEARLALLGELDARGYRFVTPTPETLRRVVSRPDNARARDIAEGALMRLSAGARCFERYRAQFGLASEGQAA